MNNVGSAGVLMADILGMGPFATAVKFSKKPYACKGTGSHIIHNDKLDEQAKKDAFIQINKKAFKGASKIAVFTAGVAGAAAIAAKTTKGSKFLIVAKGVIGNALANISIKNKSLKSMITDTKLFKQINKLPKPAKAAIGAAAVVFALVAPLWRARMSAEAAYIEAQNEKQ